MKKIIRITEGDILRLVKKIINEETNVNNPFKYEIKGNLMKNPGISIKYFSPNSEEIGSAHLLDFDNSHFLDWYLQKFNVEKNKYCVNNCYDNFLTNENCIYGYSLRVNDKFKGKGFSKKIVNKCHEIVKKNGYKYFVIIADCDNFVAQNLYKKLGYKLHQTDGVKDFYYYEV